MSAPSLAAITLDPRGGGVAGVSRLLWRAFHDRWGTLPRLHTLLGNGPTFESLHSSIARRLRFGARIAIDQSLSSSSGIFYSHLSVAQVQRFLPFKRRPYGVFLHGVEAWHPLSEQQLAVLRHASLRLSNSQFTADRVSAENPGIGPIVVCPLGLPPGSESRGAPAPPASPSEVLIVGRMSARERYKGHDQLIQAWPLVVKSVPNARLVCVGEGDDLPRLRQVARDAGIAASVVFPGFVSDAALAELYSRSAALAMPSRGEGFGLVYLEAMAHRLPCIGSVHDAAREIIQDGVTGFVVDQHDINALADRIVRLLGDEPLRRAMGEQGHRRFEAEFTADQFSRRVVPFVEAALTGEAAHLAAVRVTPR